MKHQTSRELFTYWNTRRGFRAAPERSDIEPAAIRHLLGDTFVLAFDAATEHRFRLAGTRLCALFARELKGEDFVAVWRDEDRADLRELLAAVVDEKAGVVASASGAPANDRMLGVRLELLLLPLSFRVRHEARVLGALVPMVPPYWLGAKAVGPLTLGAYRHIGAELQTLSPRLVPAAGRLRNGLTVYDGGRAD